jgi:hypothetical protein
MALTAVSAPFVLAQSSETQALRETLDKIASSIASKSDCRVFVRGNPVFEAFPGSWVAFFTADGPECDAASRAFVEAAKRLGLLAARRPTLEQVEEQVRTLLTIVREGSDCRITPRGSPSFQEGSGDWFVAYTAAGAGCDAVAEELSDLGRERQILLVRTMAPQDLIR